MNESEQQMWGSHLPVLAACVSITTGGVLELGVGNFSTPLLHAMCGSMGRKLVSVEENLEWFNQFLKWESPDHSVIRAAYDESYQTPIGLSVVFIDNSPGGERRKKDFERYIYACEFVIVHDFWNDNEEAIRPLIDITPHHVTRHQNPPTLVASVKRDIPEVIRKM